MSTSVGRAFAAAGDPIRGEPAILNFTNSNLPPELLKQQAAHWIVNGQLLPEIRGLTQEEQIKFVDKVDQVYPAVDSQNARLLTAFGSVCSAIGRLPTSTVLSQGLKSRSKVNAAYARFTDTWRGEYRGAEVAIKTFPAYDLKEAKEILWERVPMWMRLAHENILPFHGLDMTLFQLALVYDWESNGNIFSYIASHPHASRASLLFDVAKGLKYLHSLNIPHGNLKGENVVIDQSGHARLSEYGLAPISLDPSPTVAATPGAVGTRWLAPEIVNASRKGKAAPVIESKAADVFAFAIFAVEVFTGKIPLEEQKNEAVVLRISRGSGPEIPRNAQGVGLTSEMWGLLENCWQQNPSKRPTIEEVVERWWGSVESNSDDRNIVTGEPQPAPSPALRTSRPRAKNEAVQFQTGSEAVPSRTKSGPVLLRTGSEYVRFRTSPESPERGAKPRVVRLRTRSPVPRPARKRRRKYFCGLL